MIDKEFKELQIDTITVVAKIPPAEIAFVNAIIESYEGIGVVRTRDAQEGIIEFWVVPYFEDVFFAVIEDLKKELPLIIIEGKNVSYGEN